MVHNVAHSQQYCYPGTHGNYFAEGEDVPRCGATRARCARTDWLEHRFKLRLFAEPPAATVSEDAAAEPDPEQEKLDEDRPRTPAKLKRHGQYYIQSPQLVHQLLDVNRYAQRWPLIPPQELHASSIEHPSQKDSDGNNFRWLLHTRRVPVLPVPCACDWLPVTCACDWLPVPCACDWLASTIPARVSSSLFYCNPNTLHVAEACLCVGTLFLIRFKIVGACPIALIYPDLNLSII